MSDLSSFPSFYDTEKHFIPARNNLFTTVASPVSLTQQNVIDVDSTSGFPVEGVVSIGSEIIYYRAITGTSFKNLTRGFDSTAPLNHVTGDEIELRWIAAHHNRGVNAILSIEKTLGVNPQGQYPNLSERLDAALNTSNSRSDIKMLERDGITETKTGYSVSSVRSRLFKSEYPFVLIGEFNEFLGPEVFRDGLKLVRSESISLVDDMVISGITVTSGIISVNVPSGSSDLIDSNVAPGDIVLIKGTPNNDGAYIIASRTSNTITLTESIMGSDSNVGLIDIFAGTSLGREVEDFIAVRGGALDGDNGDTIIIMDPPELNEELRMTYVVKGASQAVTYSDPISVVSEYKKLSHQTQVITQGSSESFQMEITKQRAIVYHVSITALSPGASTDTTLLITGDIAETDLQYSADSIDLSITPFEDRSLFHFQNKDGLTTMNLSIKNDSLVACQYLIEIEMEAMGNNV